MPVPPAEFPGNAPAFQKNEPNLPGALTSFGSHLESEEDPLVALEHRGSVPRLRDELEFHLLVRHGHGNLPAALLPDLLHALHLLRRQWSRLLVDGSRSSLLSLGIGGQHPAHRLRPHHLDGIVLTRQ